MAFTVWHFSKAGIYFKNTYFCIKYDTFILDFRYSMLDPYRTSFFLTVCELGIWIQKNYIRRIILLGRFDIKTWFVVNLGIGYRIEKRTEWHRHRIEVVNAPCTTTAIFAGYLVCPWLWRTWKSYRWRIPLFSNKNLPVISLEIYQALSIQRSLTVGKTSWDLLQVLWKGKNY